MKVLYVEDRSDDADLTRRELVNTAPDISLQVATTLAEARTHLAAEAGYDLVLVDLNLPDGSGLELLGEIREQGLPMAAVILTGSGDEETAVAALKAGADDYLAKRDDYLARLPLVLETALARFRAESTRRARQLRVLYVERHAVDVDLARRHLARYAPHIRLEVIHSAGEVLQRLPHTAGAPSPFDVLLLDYRLPGLNALELLKTIHEERGLDLPVVLVTGQGNEEVAVQALRLGAADYLVKHPGYLYELPATLENAYHRTELVREKAALRESEEKFRSVVEQAADGIALTDEQGLVIEWNRSIANITGIAAAEVLGEPMWEVQYRLMPPAQQSPELLPALQQLLENALNTGHLPRAGEIMEREYHHPDGSHHYLQGTIFAINTGRGFRLASLTRDVTERKQAEETLRASLQEKETLLRELYHRTKNNMQVISAMLGLQSDYTDNEEIRRIFQQTNNRIHSMALVHEKLYQSQDLSSIDLADYIVDLTRLLRQAYQVTSNRITLKFDVEPVSALIDIAVPCGLVLNELLANALEHAFPEGRTGEIRIGLHRLGPGELMLEISDNGVGVPPGFDFWNTGTFGLQMIIAIAEYQLHGTVAFETEAGVTCRIRFRDDLYQERV